MKRFLLLVTLLSMIPISLVAQSRGRDEGVIVRMRITDCLASHHAFMTAMGGPQQATNDQCAEYVLVTEKVVYVIVAKNSEQLVPLAEKTPFRFQNNEILIRVDDSRRESRFHVKEMTLRPQWEREQQIEDAEALVAAHRLDGARLVSSQQ
jgi:hypothetical protein